MIKPWPNQTLIYPVPSSTEQENHLRNFGRTFVGKFGAGQNLETENAKFIQDISDYRNDSNKRPSRICAQVNLKNFDKRQLLSSAHIQLNAPLGRTIIRIL